MRRGRGSASRYHCAALRGPDCTRRTRTAGTRRWTWRIGSCLRNTGSVPENGAARRTFLPTTRPVRDSSSAPFQRLHRHDTAVDRLFTNCHHLIYRSLAGTLMSFYKKYELQRLIADGEAKTFRAIESATGRTVFLHLFNAGGMALLASLKAKLVAASGKPVPPLLEIGEFAGSQYAVTESSEPFSGLREWVDRQPEALLAASPAPPVPAPPVPAPPKPAPRQPAPPAASQPPSLLDEGTGEFTRQFGLADPAENPPELFHPRANDPPGLLDDAAGEFHRVPPPSRPSGTMPATSAEEEMGDFTRAFGAAPPKAPERAKPPARLPPKPPGPPPAPPRRYVPTPPSPSAGWAASAPAARADDTGEFTKLF